MSCTEKTVEIIERVVLISWLLKDFGWMMTDVYMGLTFGSISVLMHLILIFIDRRRCFIFYNISLLLWVSGNFTWMLVEFFETHRSSDVYFGPPLPIEGLSEHTLDQLTQMKTALFILSAFFQSIMYLLILCNGMQMPEDYNEDKDAMESARRLFYPGTVANAPSDVDKAYDTIVDLAEEFSQEALEHRNRLTLAFVENIYIVFWACKDWFWSWGTGDFVSKGDGWTIAFESLAMFCGMLSISNCVVVAYLYRRSALFLLDSITVIFWISANYVWMCGEFFLRYNNLEYDDETQHDDGHTRIAAATLFALGIALQLFVLFAFAVQHIRSCLFYCGRIASGGGGGLAGVGGTGAAAGGGCSVVGGVGADGRPLARKAGSLEMLIFKSPAPYEKLSTVFSPTHGQRSAGATASSSASDGAVADAGVAGAVGAVGMVPSSSTAGVGPAVRGGAVHAAAMRDGGGKYMVGSTFDEDEEDSILF